MNLIVFSTTLCYGISFGTFLVDIVYEMSSFFTILVHIWCHVCIYEPQMLCLISIFLPVHAQQSPDATCALDWGLTCSVTSSWALRAQANVFVIFSLPGVPIVQSAVCILATSLLFFVEPHFILRCSVCPDFIDQSGQCFLISAVVAIAFGGQCFDTVHCAMIHFSVPFVTRFRWCQSFIHTSTFARDLEGGTIFVCPSVSTCF